MNVKIREYNPALDYDSLMKLIQSEGEEWKEYLSPNYRKALANSITYVAFVGETLCGYTRALSDSGVFIWIVDLLVDENQRGHSIGKKLMECILTDYPDIDVFVMSDVDAYYEKLDYEKEGSIFRVTRSHDKT